MNEASVFFIFWTFFIEGFPENYFIMFLVFGSLIPIAALIFFRLVLLIDMALVLIGRSKRRHTKLLKMFGIRARVRNEQEILGTYVFLLLSSLLMCLVFPICIKALDYAWRTSADREYLLYISDMGFWTTTKRMLAYVARTEACTLWHSVKASPESFLSFPGLIDERAKILSRPFAFSCGGYYDAYSKICACLIGPAIILYLRPIFMRWARRLVRQPYLI